MEQLNKCIEEQIKFIYFLQEENKKLKEQLIKCKETTS